MAGDHKGPPYPTPPPSPLQMVMGLVMIIPTEGIEPSTRRLKVACSTTELRRRGDSIA
jgi:hypothetical protein